MKRRHESPERTSSRYLALQILNRADSEGAFLEPLLDAFLNRRTSMIEQDRRLLTDLVYGTVRMRNRLDWVIGHFYRGKAATMGNSLKNMLRLGLYQILMKDRIPDFAAVHESVEMAKRVLPGREGLVNGLLRNAIRKAAEIPWPDRLRDPEEYISVYHSHPRWLVHRWVKHYGMEETALICEKNNTPPHLTLRVHPDLSPERVIEELRDLEVSARRADQAPQAVVTDGHGARVREYVLSRSDRVTVQDEASQLVTELLHPLPGEAVLDLCAGTGRKTLQMAEEMRNEGHILTVDIHRRKVETLKEAVKSRGWSIVDTLAADGTADLGREFHGRFDKILLDAPCSGSGTVRRKPEIRWRVGEEEVALLTRLQGRLLQGAARYLKPGGKMVYSTCSLFREENEDVVTAFLEARTDFRWLDLSPLFPGEFLQGEGNRVFRTFPHRHDMDGFSAVILQKS